MIPLSRLTPSNVISHNSMSAILFFAVNYTYIIIQRCLYTTSLKIPQGKSERVNQKRTDKMVERKRTKVQIMMSKFYTGN